MAVIDKLQVIYPNTPVVVLTSIIDDCSEDFKEYCNIAALPQNAEGLLVQMCGERVNKLGSEGIASESAGGSSLSYYEDYSRKVYSRLNKYKKIKTV